MHSKLKKWVGHHFSSGEATGEDYKQFQRAMRTDLLRQTKAVDLKLYAFYKNHYYFMAVLKNPENNSYICISIPDVRFWPDEWVNHVLYRTMQHDKDWTGGENHYGDWTTIAELAYEMGIM